MCSDAESATEMLPFARARDDVSQVVAAQVAKLVVASSHVEMSFGFLEIHHSTCEKWEDSSVRHSAGTLHSWSTGLNPGSCRGFGMILWYLLRG